MTTAIVPLCFRWPRRARTPRGVSDRSDRVDFGIFRLAYKKGVLLSGAQASKVISSVLLREYEFEMVQPADSYRNDHSKVVVQLERPAVEGALPQPGKAMS